MIRPGFIGAISSQHGESEIVTERNITGTQSFSPMSFDYNTPFATVESQLPAIVNATLDDGTITPLNISDWLQGSFNQTTPGTYTIDGDIQLLTGITNSTNIDAHISVTVLPQITYDVYVTTTGNDSNDGSIGSPRLTIAGGISRAVALGGARTVKFGAGTFTLTAFQVVPVLISMVGEGIDTTYFKGNASLNWTANIPAFQWSFDKYLFQFTSGGTTNGNQTIRDITFDGDNRAKHGAWYVLNRNNVTFKNIKVTKFNFAGGYFISTDNLQILDSIFIDNSASEQVVSTGAITCGHNTNTLIDNLDMNEGRGYGIKAFGPAPVNPIIHNFRLLNSTISVYPFSAYGGGGISNIAVELHDSFLANCEIAYSYIDSNTSVVTPRSPVTQTPTYQNSAITVRIHHNEMNMIARGNGYSYCIEAALHNVEIYNNYLYGGQHAAIVSWNSGDAGQPAKTNWLIYNNVFHGQTSFYPVYYIRSGYTPLSNLRVYNNTFHNTAATAIYIVGTERGQNNSNWTFRNNVVLDEKTGTVGPAQGGANQLFALANGGSIANLVCTHNYIVGMPISNLPGTYNNNFTVSPQLTKSGARPDPYYRPLPTSPLINAGINVGLPFTGSAPTIGAYNIVDVVDTGDVDRVESFPARNIVTGISWATLNSQLPTAVTAILDDDSEVTLAITWAQGSYDPNTEDTYNLVGTLVLVTGVTNTGNVTATIAVTVTEATVEFTDSFDRGSLGASYTIQGNVTATLDGNDMTMGSTAASANTDRIIRNTWDNDITNARISIIYKPSEVNNNTVGGGIGFQNAVNPNPNKGVFAYFDTSSGANAGRVFIMSGDGTLSNSSFLNRGSSGATIPVVVDRRYLLVLTRELDGSDFIFTAIVTDLVTEAFVTATWTEPGAVSAQYDHQITMYQLGGVRVVEDFTAYSLDAVTSTVLIDDIFDRATLSPWAEVDLAGELTVTMNNPYVTLTSAVFAPSRLINHNTALGTALQSWRMTVDFRFTAGSGGGFLIGTKNQPVNPNVNLAFLARVDQSASKLKSYTGGGTTSDDTYTLQHTSSGNMTFTNNLDYRCILERTYNGSGNSVYLATVFLIASPGTTITSTYTWTNAPEQALYNSTKWSLTLMGNTVQVRRVLVEAL